MNVCTIIVLYAQQILLFGERQQGFYLTQFLQSSVYMRINYPPKGIGKKIFSKSLVGNSFVSA